VDQLWAGEARGLKKVPWKCFACVVAMAYVMPVATNYAVQGLGTIYCRLKHLNVDDCMQIRYLLIALAVRVTLQPAIVGFLEELCVPRFTADSIHGVDRCCWSHLRRSQSPQYATSRISATHDVERCSGSSRQGIQMLRIHTTLNSVENLVTDDRILVTCI